jgi:protein SCO1/2
VNRNVRNTVLLCVAFIALVTGAFVANFLREPVLSDAELREQGTFVLPEPRPLAPKGLLDTNGQPFDVSDLEDRWTFVFFGYTSCPDVCPIAMSALAQVERKLAEEGDEDLAATFSGLLVSVDPDRDDQATLARYVTAFSPRFSGVRGDLESLADFASQVNAAFMKVPGQGDDYLVDHTGNIVVINPAGEYHAFIRMPHEAEKILLAYRSLARGYD